MNNNKIICKPSTFSEKKLRKFKLTIQVGNGPYSYKIVHTAYGANENDAINNDKIKCRGWGFSWKLLTIKNVPGSVSRRYISMLKSFCNCCYQTSLELI